MNTKAQVLAQLLLEALEDQEGGPIPLESLRIELGAVLWAATRPPGQLPPRDDIHRQRVEALAYAAMAPNRLSDDDLPPWPDGNPLHSAQHRRAARRPVVLSM